MPCIFSLYKTLHGMATIFFLKSTSERFFTVSLSNKRFIYFHIRKIKGPLGMIFSNNTEHAFQIKVWITKKLNLWPNLHKYATFKMQRTVFPSSDDGKYFWASDSDIFPIGHLACWKGTNYLEFGHFTLFRKHCINKLSNKIWGMFKNVNWWF